MNQERFENEELSEWAFKAIGVIHGRQNRKKKSENEQEISKTRKEQKVSKAMEEKHDLPL